MYITQIEATCTTANVYFPKINQKEWKQSIISEKENNNIKFKHVLYERMSNYER